MSSPRLRLSAATRNENKPDSLTVKRNEGMEKTMKRMLPFYSFLACVQCFAGSISITGKGIVRRSPDGVKIQFTVKAADVNLSRSRDLLAAKASKIVESLNGVGISTNEIVSYNFRMEPQYHTDTVVADLDKDSDARLSEKQVFDGYQHSLSYLLTFAYSHNTLERTYGALVQNGEVVDLSISFFRSDMRDMVTEAKKLAVKDAIESATVLCEAAGTQLSSVKEIEYSDGYYAGYDVCGAAPSEDHAHQHKECSPKLPPVRVEDIEVSQTVRIKWDTK